MNAEILKKFCEKDLGRPYLNNPFSVEDFTYASDGRIAVRTPRLEGIGEVDGAPDTIIKVFTENLKAFDQATPVPKPPQVDDVKCRICKGRGRMVLCQTCNGEGYQECDLGHDHDCDDCNGNGVISAFLENGNDGTQECYECEGAGHMPDAYRGLKTGVVINGLVCVGLGYLRKLADLPAVKWSLHHRADPQAAIPFWFDGGEGILMPMRWTDSDNYLRVDTEETDAVVVNIHSRDRDRGGDNAPADLDADGRVK